MSRIRALVRPHRALIAIALTAVFAFPLGVLASHQFTDVPNSNAFHADIDAVADAGVTTGCGGGNYCPSANVTREQMAAFMNRLGALAPGKTPVVNASTSLTSQSTDGWSIGCPSGTVLGGGLCFETGSRTADDFFDATEICANLGSGIFGRGQIWQLPTGFQLRAAHVNGDITMGGTEWSSTGYYDDGVFKALSVQTSGGVIDTAFGTVLPYRCAALPLQIDNFIFIPLGEEKNGTDAAPRTNKEPGKNGAE